MLNSVLSEFQGSVRTDSHNEAPLIPETPEISRALENLVVDDYDKLPLSSRTIVCDIEQYAPNSSEVIANPNVDSLHRFRIGIAFKNTSALKLTSLARIVEKSLMSYGHAGMQFGTSAARSNLSLLILAIAQICVFKKNQVRECLTQVLECSDECSLDQVIGIPFRSPSEGVFEFGEFRYGTLDADWLSERCLHAGSNYFRLHSSKLRNKLSLCRHVASTITLNPRSQFFLNRLERHDTRQRDLLYRMMDEYFQSLGELMWESFFAELDRQQAVSAIAGVGQISSRALSPLLRTTHRIAVFNRKKQGYGWVAPTNTKVDLMLTLPEAQTEQKNAVSAGLRLESWGSHGLDNTLQKFAEYMYTVFDHELRNLHEEALLHCVFALDLLLGGKAGESLTTIIKKRTASIASCVLPKEKYGDLQKYIHKCYDFRSGYAHRGERSPLRGDFNVNESVRGQMERMIEIARIVFAAACWARQQHWCTGLDSWHAHLDILRTKLNANIEADQEVEQLGLGRIRRDTSLGDAYVIDWEKQAEPSFRSTG